MKYAKYGFVILWMTVIFLFSNQTSIESTKTSNQVILTIASFISNDYNEGLLSNITFIVRKIAHLTLYLVLGYLVINVSTKSRKGLILSFLICLLYACSDEFHQLFISGRSGEIRDVFIDTVGSYLGILFYKVTHLKQFRK